MVFYAVARVGDGGSSRGAGGCEVVRCVRARQLVLERFASGSTGTLFAVLDSRSIGGFLPVFPLGDVRRAGACVRGECATGCARGGNFCCTVYLGRGSVPVNCIRVDRSSDRSLKCKVGGRF